MARQQRRYAPGPNSRTMVAVCRRTSYVLMTPQIAIRDRLQNLSCQESLATRVPSSHTGSHEAGLVRDNPLELAQSPGIWRYLQILSGELRRDAAVIRAPLAAQPGKFDRESPVRRTDRLHSPRLTMLWRKSRQSVEFMA